LTWTGRAGLLQALLNSLGSNPEFFLADHAVMIGIQTIEDVVGAGLRGLCSGFVGLPVLT